MPGDEGGLKDAIVGVLGAGPVGCLVGICLACAGADVTVVDWDADSKLVGLVQRLGIRAVTASLGGAGDNERRLGPGEGGRRWTKDVRDLKSCSIIFVDVPRANSQELAAVLLAHTAAGADVVLLQNGTGMAQELVSHGVVKGKWRGGSILESSVQLRAELILGDGVGSVKAKKKDKKAEGTPPTVVWYTPSHCSQICVDGRPACHSAAKRAAQILASVGLPTVVEDKISEVQVTDMVFHGLADVLCLSTGQDSLAAAFNLASWRLAMACLVEESLQVLKAAGVPVRRLVGMTPMAQRNYVQILRAPACIFSMFCKQFPGELLPGRSGLPVAEALRAAEELDQVGRRHGISTPRLSLMLERVAPLEHENGGRPLDARAAADFLRELVKPPRRPVQQCSSSASTEVASAPNLASTFVVSKEQRLSELRRKASASETTAAPANAADLFGVDPADPSGSSLGRLEPEAGPSPAQPSIESADLDLRFAKYEQSKGAAKPAAGDVKTAMQRYEESKGKSRYSEVKQQ